jgi:hypothetical protein
MENGTVSNSQEQSRDIFAELDVLKSKQQTKEAEIKRRERERLTEARELFTEMIDDERLWRSFGPSLDYSERDRKKIILRNLATGSVQDVEVFLADLDSEPLEWSFCHTVELAHYVPDVRVTLKPGLSAEAVTPTLRRIIEWIEREPAILKPRKKPCPTCGHRELNDDEIPF